MTGLTVAEFAERDEACERGDGGAESADVDGDEEVSVVGGEA